MSNQPVKLVIPARKKYKTSLSQILISTFHDHVKAQTHEPV